MRTARLLLLVAWATLACMGSEGIRSKRDELLSRSKRQQIGFELVENDPGPFPKDVYQVYSEATGTVAKHMFRISGAGVTEPPFGIFSIDMTNGKIYVHRPIDREEKSVFHIRVNILDEFTNQQIDNEISFDVEIKDLNDNEPKFLRTKIVEKVPENAPEGFMSVRLHAVDPDQPNSPNSTMTISIDSQNPKVPKFEIEQTDERTAQLKYSGCFDYDKIKRYDIIAKAMDHGTPPLSSTAQITILIADKNTHYPTFKQPQYFVKVDEMKAVQSLVRLEVDDKDTAGSPAWQAKYFFVSGNEDGVYEVVTDPKTNEGIVSIVKPKDYIGTTNSSVIIGVENVEYFFHCRHKTGPVPKPNTVNLTITTIDLDDPPTFDEDKTNVDQKEESG